MEGPIKNRAGCSSRRLALQQVLLGQVQFPTAAVAAALIQGMFGMFCILGEWQHVLKGRVEP